MEPGQVSATEVLSDAIYVMIREGQLFLLLIAFLSIMSLILLWPVMDWYVLFFQDFPNIKRETWDRLEALMKRDSTYLRYLFWPSFLLSLGAVVLWTRAVASGAAGAFGSLGEFLRRIVWVCWRYICAFFILFAALFIIVLPFSFIRPGTQEELILAVVLYPFFLILLMAVTLLVSVSVHAEARDFHLPIHKAFYYMRGNLLRASGVFILAMLAFLTLQWMVWFLVSGFLMGDNSLLRNLAFFVVFAFSGIGNFFWVGFGAGFAMRLVPEMR